MLYPTANQPLIIVVMLLTGFLCGIMFDSFRCLTYLSGGDKWSKHFFDFLATILSFVLLFFANLWTNYGQFRLFVVILFLLGFAIERIISKFLWTKLVIRWYNIFKLDRINLKKKNKDGRKTEKEIK